MGLKVDTWIYLDADQQYLTVKGAQHFPVAEKIEESLRSIQDHSFFDFLYVFNNIYLNFYFYG